jgi:hypothetical protein
MECDQNRLGLMKLKEAEDADARERIAALEEKAGQHDGDSVVLQDKFRQLSTDFGSCLGEVLTLRSAAVGMRGTLG